MLSSTMCCHPQCACTEKGSESILSAVVVGTTVLAYEQMYHGKTARSITTAEAAMALAQQVTPSPHIIAALSLHEGKNERILRVMLSSDETAKQHAAKYKEVNDRNIVLKNLYGEALTANSTDAQAQKLQVMEQRAEDAEISLDTTASRLQKVTTKLEKANTVAAATQRDIQELRAERNAALDSITQSFRTEMQAFQKSQDDHFQRQDDRFQRQDDRIQRIEQSNSVLKERVAALEERELLVRSIHQREIISRVRDSIAGIHRVPQIVIDGRTCHDWKRFFQAFTLLDLQAWATATNLQHVALNEDVLALIRDGAADGNMVAHYQLASDLPGVAISVKNIRNEALDKLFLCAQMLSFGSVNMDV